MAFLVLPLALLEGEVALAYHLVMAACPRLVVVLALAVALAPVQEVLVLVQEVELLVLVAVFAVTAPMGRQGLVVARSLP